MTFLAALLAAGLRPRDIVADGRIRRCTTDRHPHKRNGWYCLHPDGRGVWGDWSMGTSEAMGTWQDDRARSTVDMAAINRKMAEQRAKERAARMAAIQAARRYWMSCTPINRAHPYLERKGLSPVGTKGLRVNDGRLVIPVTREGRIISLQAIHPDGTKRFWPGAPVKGGSYVIDRPDAALTVLCEGFATGLALFQACKMARVVVAFDAGNLVPVAQAMSLTGSVVVAADDDHGTQARRGFNPGMDKARNVADLIGCGVAVPQCEGTDFADMLKELGPAGARRIERIVQARARYVVRETAA